MLNSRISDVFLRDFMLLKWLSTDVPLMLCEHPQPILDVQTVSFTKSDWRLIVYFSYWNVIADVIYIQSLFYHGATAPSGPRRPRCWGFTITLRHTTVDRSPLDDWSARNRDLYLTTHNTHNRHTSMPLATKRNEEILEEMKVEPVNRKLRRYKPELLRHVTRTNSSRMPNVVLNCRPNSRRQLGRPLKSLWDEAETGLKPFGAGIIFFLILAHLYIKCE